MLFNPSVPMTMKNRKEKKMETRRQVVGILRMALVVVLALLAIATPLDFGSDRQTYAKEPPILVYYDGHMHTTRSDGSGSVADIKATALSRGLNAVIITDHCASLTLAEWESLVAETAAASDSTFLALAGVEVTGSDGMFNRDHINALNVPDPFVGDDALELCPEEVWESPPNPAGTGPLYPENLTKWVDYIESQGGIAVHNHPSGTTHLGYGVSHMEVYNQGHVDDVASYALALGYPPEQAWEFGITLNNFALYGERDVNMPVEFPPYGTIPLRSALYYATLAFSGIGQWLGSPEAPLSSWDDLLMAYVDGTVDAPIFGLANSDAHNTGDPDSRVGTAKNGVYLKKLTAQDFYKAIEAGRTFGTTGPSLALDVNGKLMGERAVIPRGTARINLTANSESPAVVLIKIDIIKNGVLWKTIPLTSPTYEATLSDDAVTKDGYYRVELTAIDMVSGSYQFAWSNPVFVKVPAPSR
jgi:hypothetical protein